MPLVRKLGGFGPPAIQCRFCHGFHDRDSVDDWCQEARECYSLQQFHVDPRKFVTDNGRKIENVVRTFVRDLCDRRHGWGGTDEEYQEWSENRLRQFLRNVAENVHAERDYDS